MIGLILVAVVIAAFALILPFAGLADYAEDPEAAMTSIGIFIGAIILFVSQVTVWRRRRLFRNQKSI